MMNGTFTWDFPRLFFELKKGILKAYQAGHKEIAGIGIDTWGVDFGLLSRQGELLGNPVHYRDARTDGMIELACSRSSEKEIYDTTGIAFQKFNTLYQLLAMAEKKSVLLENADTLLFIPDLFNYYLTGEKLCEYTITSTSQLYDPVRGVRFEYFRGNFLASMRGETVLHDRVPLCAGHYAVIDLILRKDLLPFGRLGLLPH